MGLKVTMSEENTTKDFADLYADLTACFLALANALENNGIVSKGEIAEAGQERLLSIQLACQAEGIEAPPFHLLRMLAIDLSSA